ncbi:hypothetical protein OSB04_un000942 [Centaurea solstitialis]|uniref:No apical meristem-associated C-terminal domain-containing protein n=1 Tax=Centaurea solstitialis TaxID=347529 RepID=A0AA38SGF7_9ASTR|nr:hypothetical protein OSB04_un000942 [Centaurea solstitialis]
MVRMLVNEMEKTKENKEFLGIASHRKKISGHQVGRVGLGSHDSNSISTQYIRFEKNSKWKAMNKKILAFNGIYNQIMNNRASGESDVNLLKKVRSQYQMTESHVFPHENYWEIVRHSPKRDAIPLMSGGSSSRSTKRTRTSGSSDAHFGQDSDEVEVPPPKRPVGRGKAKKALRGGQSSTPTTDLYASWDRNLAEKNGLQDEKT